MGASITFGTSTLYGTNSAICTLIESLDDLALRQLGSKSPIAEFLSNQNQGFFPGIWIDLDVVVLNKEDLSLFAALLRESCKDLEVLETWKPLGRLWLNTELKQFLTELENEL